MHIYKHFESIIGTNTCMRKRDFDDFCADDEGCSSGSCHMTTLAFFNLGKGTCDCRIIETKELISNDKAILPPSRPSLPAVSNVVNSSPVIPPPFLSQINTGKSCTADNLACIGDPKYSICGSSGFCEDPNTPGILNNDVSNVSNDVAPPFLSQINSGKSCTADETACVGDPKYSICGSSGFCEDPNTPIFSAASDDVLESSPTVVDDGGCSPTTVVNGKVVGPGATCVPPGSWKSLIGGIPWSGNMCYSKTAERFKEGEFCEVSSQCESNCCKGRINGKNHCSTYHKISKNFYGVFSLLGGAHCLPEHFEFKPFSKPSLSDVEAAGGELSSRCTDNFECKSRCCYKSSFFWRSHCQPMGNFPIADYCIGEDLPPCSENSDCQNLFADESNLKPSLNLYCNKGKMPNRCDYSYDSPVESIVESTNPTVLDAPVVAKPPGFKDVSSHHFKKVSAEICMMDS